MFILLVSSIIVLCGAQQKALRQDDWSGMSSCGKTPYSLTIPQSRIVGGSNANLYQFPWQISIQNDRGYHFCGGTLINREWIVTAAHCVIDVYKQPSKIRAHAGRYNLAKSNEPYAQVRIPSKIIMHDMYSSWRQDHDIALIKVSPPYDYSTGVVPICSPITTISAHYDAKPSVISGWGHLYFGGKAPEVLQFTTVNVLDYLTCNRRYQGQLTADMLCAGEEWETQTDACQGDSGGPLVYDDNNDGQFELIGAVSWGIGCASGYPGVYASVPYFRDWITAKIGPLPPKATTSKPPTTKPIPTTRPTTPKPKTTTKPRSNNTPSPPRTTPKPYVTTQRATTTRSY